MKVLIIGTLYEPDLGPSAPLYTLLSEHLVLRGHQVKVITMVPHYPTGQVSVAYRGKLIWRDIENGVQVTRIGLPSVDRSKLAQRLLQFVCYQVGATIASLGQKYDVVLAANPFLTVWLPFAWLVALKHRPAIYSVQDLYPNVGIRLGVFRHSGIIKAATWLERFCLDHSTIVQIVSESFRAELRTLGVDEKKIVLAYNWVDTDLIHPLPRNNPLAQKYKLDNRFVVLYAGNIGRSQGLEHILSVAEQRVIADQDIQFVLVGDGSEREYLRYQVEQRHLKNVQFLAFQPRDRLPEVLACADISLVPLRKGIAFGSLPSKVYSIFASGRPVLASVDEGSETWNLVSDAKAGICVLPENPSEISKAILSLKNDPELRETFGRNGRLWVEKYHSPKAAAEQFEKLFMTAISNKEQ